MEHFTIDEADWNELMRLSREAQDAPVMALSSADALSGRDFAGAARERVYSYWRELGCKYGFDASEIRPVDEKRRIIAARRGAPQ
jgi:hypothetical protein